MGGARAIDYLVGDPNSRHNPISNFSIGNKRPDSNHRPLFCKLGNSVGSRPPAMFNQGQVLHPNHKKTNQYVQF